MDLNHRPRVYKTRALTPELRGHVGSLRAKIAAESLRTAPVLVAAVAWAALPAPPQPRGASSVDPSAWVRDRRFSVEHGVEGLGVERLDFQQLLRLYRRVCHDARR